MRAVRVPHALLVGDREVGVAAVVARAAVDQARLQRAEQHRHVDALDRREALDVRVDQVGEAVQVDGAARGAERGPGREGLGRGGDGEIGLALPAARDLAERLLVDRREVRERALARDALAADEVVGRDLDPRDASLPTSPERERADVDHRVAAVDRDHGAVDVRRVGGEQPGDRARDLLRRARPAQRHVLRDRRRTPPRAVPSPSASISSSAIGVRTQPGQTQFARTPAGPWSSAMHCVSIASAAFDEQ